MAFYDVVTEMGYETLDLDGIIEITKKDTYPNHEPLGDIVILFDTTEKKLMGYVKPLRNILDLDDMCHIYKLYLEMKKHLKFFAEKSKYDII